MVNSEIDNFERIPIERLLADARQKLVETGTRNRLIHVNRKNSKANALNIVRERSDDVYHVLRDRRRTMKFLATGRDSKKSGDNDSPLLEAIEIKTDKPLDKSRYRDFKLESKLGPDGLQKRLIRLHGDARTAEEEQGINILYLALGFLSWFEAKDSAVPREAPLILLPVELKRNIRTSTYDISIREDEIITNLALKKRLYIDFGIELPEIDEDAKDWKPSSYFDRVRNVIEAKPAWSIEQDGIQLGFFSFAKLLMLRDLEPGNWPNGGLGASPLINGLLHTGFAQIDPLFAESDRLDDLLSPADIIQVVDADASQTRIIEEVRAGRSLVVQGPPGTGKSQTITNIIAAAVHDGKSVLFVAEKMAALSVVHERLKGVGLETICLELHSRAANKKTVLAELVQTLSQQTAVPDQPEEPERLKSFRDGLNFISSKLHNPINETGETPYTIMAKMARLTGQGVPAPTLSVSGLDKLSAEHLSALEKEFDRYNTITQESGPSLSHPFAGTGNLNLQPVELEKLSLDARQTAEQINKLVNAVKLLSDILDFNIESMADVKPTLDLLRVIAEAPNGAKLYLDTFNKDHLPPRLHAALATAKEWQDLLLSNTVYTDAAWSAPLLELRGSLVNGIGSFSARVGSGYRSASRSLATLLKDELPKNANQRLHLLDDLFAKQAKRKNYLEQEQFLKNALGAHWDGEQTPFDQISTVCLWLDRLAEFDIKMPENQLSAFVAMPEKAKNILRMLDNTLEIARTALNQIKQTLQLDSVEACGADSFEQASLKTLVDLFSRIDENALRYGEWSQLKNAAKKIGEANLSSLLEQIDNKTLGVKEAKQELRFARAEAIWDAVRRQVPEIDKISKSDRHRFAEHFKACEYKRFSDLQTLIRARHLSQLPGGANAEMAVLQGEFGKKSKHKPIRKLIVQAGSMIQKIKPVLLMSPISVAQFLPPEQISFDILVIDEASQVRPEDALGAIARCRQIVVVGDQKQLPPTTYFDRMTSDMSNDDDEDDSTTDAARVTELESILSLSEARAIPQRRLVRHYRSRDPSLIAVSNREFYGNSLVLPPSPVQNDDAYGLQFTRVNGAYSSMLKGDGSPGTNKIEAQAVVAAVAQHARNMPEMSLGVVSFSVKQRKMISEILEFERRSDSILDNFLREGRPEDVIVKNIENVQGDERDVIMISVGYGPREPGGRLASMNFGSINSEGGERRVNVMFSRARVHCQIFASFDPGDIDLSRTRKNGPRVLRRFLEYADTGNLYQDLPSGGLADTHIENDIADVIRSLNFSVDRRFGNAGFLIDLGVRHPDHGGQYMLAVECDGATYRDAAWARERDRLRQDVLERLGWHVHRIWSTDWFCRRAQEIERLTARLKQVREEIRHGIKIDGANRDHLDPASDKYESAYRVEIEDSQVQQSDEHETSDSVEINVPKVPQIAEHEPAHSVKIEVPETTETGDEPYILANVDARGSTDPHEATPEQLLDLVTAIVSVEGPVHQDQVAHRLASAFGKARAGRKINELTVKVLNQALNLQNNSSDTAKLLCEDSFWFTQLQAQNVPVRSRAGQRTTIQKAENIPPLEIRAAIERIKATNGAAKVNEIIKGTARLFGFEKVRPDLKAVISRQLKKSSGK